MKLQGATVVGAVLLMGAGAAADTLVLRNGRRIVGELVEYRNDRVAWRDDRGRSERFDRSDVRRIEFDDNGFGDSSASWNDDRPGSGRPSGMREREVSVQAAQGWTSTGVRVERGDRIYVEAHGVVRWGPDRSHGPEGEKNSPRNPNRPIPGRNAAALIGRIDDGDPFFIGGDDEVRVPESGTLFLGVNDDYLQDNAGSFKITISY